MKKEKKLSEQELKRQQFVDFVNQIWKPANIDMGCFGGINKKYWVEINGKEYMFKFTRGKDDNSDFAEVFVSYLSCLLGFKCVNATFCKDFFSSDDKNVDNDTTYGTLIESFRAKNVVETISLSQLIKKYSSRTKGGRTPTWEVEEICKEFCEDNNLIISSKLSQELKEMALMDYLLVQYDRNPNNIEFLIKEKHGKKLLTLAPMFDNGFCLHLESMYVENVFNAKENSMELGLAVNPAPDLFIQQKKDHDFSSFNYKIVENLAKELLNNKPLMNLYENFKNLNIKSEIKFVKSLYKRNFKENKQSLVEACIKNRINLLELELAKQIIKKNFKENENECDFTL